MSNEQNPAASDPDLNTRVSIVERMLFEFARAGAGVSDNILGGGFGSVSDQLETVSRHLQTISAQMAPLAELTHEPEIGEDEKARLEYLIKGWTPPTWSGQKGLSSLSFDGLSVRFIGEVVPKRDAYGRHEVHYRSTAS